MATAPSSNGRHTGDSLVALEHKFLMADAQPAFDAQLQHALPGAAQEARFDAGADMVARFCQVVGNTIYLEWMAYQCGYGVVMLKTEAERRAELLEEQLKEERIKTAALMEALRSGR